MKTAVILPHENTRSFIDEMQKKTEESLRMAGILEDDDCFFAFPTPFCCLAYCECGTDSSESAAEERRKLVELRDALNKAEMETSGGGKYTLQNTMIIDGPVHAGVSVKLDFPFQNVIEEWCLRNGLVPIPQENIGFLAGIIKKKPETRLIGLPELPASFSFSVFRLAFMDITPDISFINSMKTSAGVPPSAGSEAFSLSWKVLSSLWKGKLKEA